MLLPKILLVIVLISTLFIIEKFNILYVKLPGFEKLQKIYLSQQDICGKEYQREKEISKIVLEDITKKSNELMEREFSSASYLEEKNKIIITKVISIPPDNFPKEIFIYGGKEDGIKKYYLVMKDGKLIGRVVEVFENSSKVLTVFSPSFYVEAIFSKSKMRAILRGSEDGKMKIFASLGPIEMIEGDEAVTSGSKFSAPAGIKIGTVKDDAVQISTHISDILYVSVIAVEEEIKRDENSETKK